MLQFDQAIANFMAEQENGNDRDTFNSSIPQVILGLGPPTGGGCSWVMKGVRSPCSPSSAAPLSMPTPSNLAPARATHHASPWSAFTCYDAGEREESIKLQDPFIPLFIRSVNTY